VFLALKRYLIFIEPKLVFKRNIPFPSPIVPLIRLLLILPFTVIGRSVFIEPWLVASSTWPVNSGGAADGDGSAAEIDIMVSIAGICAGGNDNHIAIGCGINCGLDGGIVVRNTAGFCRCQGRCK